MKGMRVVENNGACQCERATYLAHIPFPQSSIRLLISRLALGLYVFLDLGELTTRVTRPNS